MKLDHLRFAHLRIFSLLKTVVNCWLEDVLQTGSSVLVI